jgi:hypothetical protein
MIIKDHSTNCWSLDTDLSLIFFLLGQGKEELKFISLWWRDLWNLGGENDGCWFGSNIRSVLGDGKGIQFWHEKWIGICWIFGCWHHFA